MIVSNIRFRLVPVAHDTSRLDLDFDRSSFKCELKPLTKPHLFSELVCITSRNLEPHAPTQNNAFDCESTRVPLISKILLRS